MSGISDPSGPLPSRVYRRRRLVVLLVVVAIIAVVVLIFVRPPADAAAPAPAATDAAQAPVDASAPVDPGAATGPVACTPDQVSVSPVTDADSYDAGVEPQLSWTLANTGSVACIINVGTSQQVFTVTSGDEKIWTSTDCQTDPKDFDLTLEPASSGAAPTSSASFTWPRERSSTDTCAADAVREQVAAGGASYHLQVSVGGFTSSDTKQFLLY
ncbi:hypothetical protein ACFSBZ_10130 [Amnibacterium flavum]|uniref:DUF4232 domain-containing protein n=1 Tax=Amnibacterium flavum TaxID=2173173 RepID=A0A2V1HRK0_9MICO|nr:hypothetical protein [Amnibacterium flavum]PVZ95205.1 hypothetical protein DDQ50_01360 [Amnibacterium flavum]